MASELFQNLFVRAVKLDCPLLEVIGSMGHLDLPGELFEGRRTEVIDYAVEMLEAWYEFNSRFNSVVFRHGLDPDKTKMLCDRCGRDDCPNASPVFFVYIPSGTGKTGK